MVTLHPEYVVDEKQHRKAVLLPVAEWVQIVAERRNGLARNSSLSRLCVRFGRITRREL
jgi:hypothetical protein